MISQDDFKKLTFSRDVFRTLSNIYYGAIWEYVLKFKMPLASKQ